MVKDNNRLERKKSNTREKIFSTAIKLFKNKGYENTTVDEIVEKADVAKGTFFNYFPTKSSLLIYLNTKRVENLKALIIEEFNKNPLSTKEKISKLIELMARDIEKDIELSKFIILESLRFYGDIFNEETAINYEFIYILQNIIEEGKKNQDVSKQVDSMMLAEIIAGTYIYTVFLWLSAKRETSVYQKLKSKIDLLLDSLLS